MNFRLMFGAFLLLVLSTIASAAQVTQPQCTADIGAPSTLISSGLTYTGTTGAFTDPAPVDGVTYAYIVTANIPLGAFYACSNAVTNVVIPATGTHTVALTWNLSTTANVQYSVYRASAPLNPTGLAAAVN